MAEYLLLGWSAAPPLTRFRLPMLFRRRPAQDLLICHQYLWSESQTSILFTELDTIEIACNGQAGH